MHHCLKITKILKSVFNNLDYYTHHCSLYALALVTKGCHEPALDVLWGGLFGSVLPLVKTLPAEVWEETGDPSTLVTSKLLFCWQSLTFALVSPKGSSHIRLWTIPLLWQVCARIMDGHNLQSTETGNWRQCFPGNHLHHGYVSNWRTFITEYTWNTLRWHRRTRIMEYISFPLLQAAAFWAASQATSWPCNNDHPLRSQSQITAHTEILGCGWMVLQGRTCATGFIIPLWATVSCTIECAKVTLTCEALLHLAFLPNLREVDIHVAGDQINIKWSAQASFPVLWHLTLNCGSMATGIEFVKRMIQSALLTLFSVCIEEPPSSM